MKFEARYHLARVCIEWKRAGQARPCRASDEGPEARRAFEVGPRAVLKIAKISEIMAKLGGFFEDCSSSFILQSIKYAPCHSNIIKNQAFWHKHPKQKLQKKL